MHWQDDSESQIRDVADIDSCLRTDESGNAVDVTCGVSPPRAAWILRVDSVSFGNVVARSDQKWISVGQNSLHECNLPRGVPAYGISRSVVEVGFAEGIDHAADVSPREQTLGAVPLGLPSARYLKRVPAEYMLTVRIHAEDVDRTCPLSVTVLQLLLGEQAHRLERERQRNGRIPRAFRRMAGCSK